MRAVRSMAKGCATSQNRSGLDDDEGDGREDEDLGIGDDLAQIDAHADEEEESAEQQAFEGLDDGFDLAAELGFGEQQAGDKGAEAPSTGRRGSRHSRLRPRSAASSP